MLRPVNPFCMGDIHAWEVSTGVYVSDERVGKKLYSFPSWDAAVNWVFYQNREIARAMNAHAKNA